MIPLPPSRLRARLTTAPRTRPARVTDNRPRFRRDWTRQVTASHITEP